VSPGQPYGEAIIDAINGCRVMVLLLSASANASVHIPKEVERAVSKGATIVPLRIEDVTPGRSLDYFIGSVHWLDALTPPLEKHLENLALTVQRLLPERAAAPELAAAARPQRPFVATPIIAASPAVAASAKAQGPLREGSRLIYLAAAGAVVLVVVGLVLWHQFGQTSAGTPTASSPVAAVAPQPAALNVASIAGCWDWFTGGTVAAARDGVMRYGATSGHWREVNAADRTYEISWSTGFVDTVTIAADGQSLTGQNAQGVQITAARSATACQTPARVSAQAPAQEAESADQNSQGATAGHAGSSLRKTGKSILKHLTE
jgi:hypothetical protein